MPAEIEPIRLANAFVDRTDAPAAIFVVDGPTRSFRRIRMLARGRIADRLHVFPGTPAELFEPGLTELRDLGTRLPIVVTETASAEGHAPGHSKADWITQLFDYLNRQGDVRGVLWFHERKERDWRVNSSPAAETAYRRAVAKLR